MTFIQTARPVVGRKMKTVSWKMLSISVELREWFDCLFVCQQDYGKKPLTWFSWNLEEGGSMGRGRTHSILEQIRITGQIFSCFLLLLNQYNSAAGRPLVSSSREQWWFSELDSEWMKRRSSGHQWQESGKSEKYNVSLWLFHGRYIGYVK